MAITHLMPWRRNHEIMPARREANAPLSIFQDRMGDVFQRFFDDFPFAPLEGRDLEGLDFEGLDNMGDFHPHVDVTETDKEIKVAAELPGMNEKDIEVSLAHDLLTIRGEKKEEKEEKGKKYFRMERSYGSFQRSVRLPVEVEQDKVEADFKNGVLTITLPKILEAQQNKKIITVKSD